jgi:signal transduction histidine kinase
MGSRLFRYFAIFAVSIMLILWLLQILFMQTFYQEMKRNELKKIASTIEEGYGTDTLFDTVMQLTMRSDIYVQIQCGNVILFETTSGNPSDRMSRFADTYDIQVLKERLIENDLSNTVVKLTSKKNSDSTEAMIYASVLDGPDGFNDKDTDSYTYLFIYSPLTAVGTTIDILAKMLIIVTIISILFGLILSIIISRRLARPIHNITESAAQLAEGNYNITFDGSGYAETEELAATLNYTSYELSKSDKLQKDLVANVSHDLKTPLTMVKSYAEMVRDLSGDNPEKRARHLQVIINEADRLNDLVNDLTALSKMQANVDVLNAETVDLAYIARESMESFSIHSEQNGFDFNIDVEGDPYVTADEKKIRQVFSNLIGNAVRYSGDNKKIEITIKELDESVRCEITDHGQGIAAEDIESIWDRYYQSSSNHSRTSKGSGLGLSIVKQIFILHDAKYGVNSVENEGSTFWFELKKQQEDK